MASIVGTGDDNVITPGFSSGGLGAPTSDADIVQGAGRQRRAGYLSASDNLRLGEAGADLLAGGEGADTLDAGADADILLAAAAPAC